MVLIGHSLAWESESYFGTYYRGEHAYSAPPDHRHAAGSGHRRAEEPLYVFRAAPHADYAAASRPEYAVVSDYAASAYAAPVYSPPTGLGAYTAPVAPPVFGAYTDRVAPVAPAVVTAYSAPVAAASSAYSGPSIPSSQYHSQDEEGNYSFGYNNVNGAREEMGNSGSVVTGSYTGAGGLTVRYIADQWGFRLV